MGEKPEPVKGPEKYAEIIRLAATLSPDEVRAALHNLAECKGDDEWIAKAKELLTDAATARTPAIEIRLLVTAPPGLSHAAVAGYIRTAVDSYSGCLRGDDPCRSISVARVQRLGWVDVKTEEQG